GFGIPAALAGVCWTGFRNGDYAVIGARAGTTASGIYWRAYQLAVDYPRKITSIMVQVGFPVLSRTGGVEEMFAMRRRMTRLLAVLVMPLLTGLALFAPIAIPWLFGPAWTSAVVPTQILAAGSAAYAITLRALFNDVWADLVKLLGRVLPQAPQRRIAKQIAIVSARFST